MANANVIDELVVKLTLDAESYIDAEKTVDEAVDRTEDKAKARDGRRRNRDRDQQSRWRSMGTAAEGFRAQAVALYTAIAAVPIAIAASLGGLYNFELGLRRQGVATGLSNKELQAYGATARRLGADANAGAEAVANLAREQKTMQLTGQAPTLQALARIGVNVSNGRAPVEMIEEAQQRYRQSSPAQRQQIESQLAVQGVSADLILMIKSETDARAAYNQSLAESTTENKAALSQLADTYSAVQNRLVSVANSLATVLQPALVVVSGWMSTLATRASAFADQMQAAGGGADGFMAALDQDAPQLSSYLRDLGDKFEVLGQIIDVAAQGWKDLGAIADQVRQKFMAWLHLSPTATKAVDWVGHQATAARNWLGGIWTDSVNRARTDGNAPTQVLRRAVQALTPVTVSADARTRANDLNQRLIMRYGLTPAQAAGVTANALRESGGNPAAFNPAGGGTGAHGLFQLRGDRAKRFQARYGVMPDQASIDQQLEFIFTDPSERQQLLKSLQAGDAGGGTAEAYGAAVSRLYEIHGNAAEDATRGRLAAQIAQPADGNKAVDATAGTSPTININGPVTVRADNPQELTKGLQRVSSITNYNTAMR